MEIRNATMDDLQAIAAVEAACFPAAEAATAEEFAGRLAHYAGHFWLLFEQGELVAFVDGFCTDTPDLTDEMYADAALHDENGAWQMIFGVNTLPRCRCRGYAGLLLQRAIADARAQGRKGLVLTCKEKLLHYYAKFGFVNEGVSDLLFHRWSCPAAPSPVKMQCRSVRRRSGIALLKKNFSAEYAQSARGAHF